MSIATGIITTVCISRDRPVVRTRNCTGYEEREMIIDLSLWAYQITGLGAKGVCVKKRRDIFANGYIRVPHIVRTRANTHE